MLVYCLTRLLHAIVKLFPEMSLSLCPFCVFGQNVSCELSSEVVTSCILLVKDDLFHGFPFLHIF